MHLNSSTGGNVRTLPARKDASADRQQAAADDAALARDERNEEIAENITFDKLEISTTDCAVIDAALARGHIEDVYAVWGFWSPRALPKSRAASRPPTSRMSRRASR